VLKLTPAHFWALSLPEWRALIEARFPQAPALERSAFETMMQSYPDG
jgi:uncharacterized phage protein (TIGR02216 family)